ncbi:hypothetical protein [Roseobacter sp. HKCCA0434]|uniref:hypothetical protein n=1 Tax=Roseobacter sp. HKCCA0434 TaxID=3079297 RepID=UPI002905D35E|nr:hypothetical protein [Roseobacter sp. HKCCA0434]
MQSKIRALVAGALLAAIAGCTPPMPRLDAAALRDLYKDRTLMAYLDGYGTAIEYLAPDGTAHLWSYFEDDIPDGRWWTETRPDGIAQICFQYFSDLTPARADGEEGAGCSTDVEIKERTYELVAGDPFALEASRSVPFALAQGTRVTLAEAAQRAGVTAPLGPNLADWRN